MEWEESGLTDVVTDLIDGQSLGPYQKAKIKIMNGTIFLLVGMVKDKFANFWIYSLLSPFESKDYAYTLSITHENGRSKFSHYNGQAYYLFSRIFLGWI